MKTRSEALGEALAHARAGLTVAIVSEGREQADEAARLLTAEATDVKSTLRTGPGTCRLTFPSGGSIRFYTQRQADRLRGACYDRVYVDVMPLTLATAGLGTLEVFA